MDISAHYLHLVLRMKSDNDCAKIRIDQKIAIKGFLFHGLLQTFVGIYLTKKAWRQRREIRLGVVACDKVRREKLLAYGKKRSWPEGLRASK